MSENSFQVLWMLGWGVLALIAWATGAPDWMVWAPLIIGGLAVPVIVFND